MRIEDLVGKLPKPVYYPTHKERESSMRELVENGEVRVHLEGRFNNSNVQNLITQAITVNVWALPSNELGNELPLQASSVHKARSATLVYDAETPSSLERLDIVAKPVEEVRRAFREVRVLSEALRRGIPTVEPVAVVETINDANHGLVITALKKGIIPIAAINLDGLNTDQGYSRAKNLVSNLGDFVAESQGKGLFHNDLHPGNIGLDITNGRSDSFVLFDLERAEIMNADKMRRLLSPFHNKRIPKVPVQIDLKFLNDAANLLAGIVTYNPRINEEAVKSAFLSGYFGSSELYARYPDHFNQEFAIIYPQKKTKQERTLQRIRARQDAAA